MAGTFAGGIDVGSCTTKAVVVNDEPTVVADRVIYSGTDFEAAAERCWTEALAEAGVGREDVSSVVSTGYGRKSVTFAGDSVTEISCHGRGVLHYFPGPVTVVDIGGQDNKVIKLDEQGRRVSFKMNRKCAAGTGAFLEEMALRLRLPIEELNGLAESANGEVTMGSYCTVFSATEVLEKIKAGHKVDEIVRGLFRSVLKRVLEMDTLGGTVVLSGGVVEHNPYLVEMLKEEVNGDVRIAPHAQVIGALGAALYALDRR